MNLSPRQRSWVVRHWRGILIWYIALAVTANLVIAITNPDPIWP